MVQSRIFIALALVGALVSCSKTGTDAQDRTDGKYEQYFPLAVGNDWHYLVNDGAELRDEHVRVAGIKHFGRNQYYIVERTRTGLDVKDTSFYRWNYDGKLMRMNGGVETTYIDFSKTEAGLLTGAVVGKDADFEVPAGTFHDCLRVAFSKTDTNYYRFAPGVGLVSVAAPGGTAIHLKIAKINGVSYPG